jgi:mitochondrial fission protein ELM1
MRYKNEATLVGDERKAKSIFEACEENDLSKYIPASSKQRIALRVGGREERKGGKGREYVP